MSGQAFSRIALAVNTVVLVPILIRAWGVAGYGQWIALTALASYIGLSNFGLVTTSANEMIIATGANDTARAERAYQASINVTAYLVLPIITAIVLLLCELPISSTLHLSQINRAATQWIIICSGFALFMQTLRGLMAAALYSVGSYGFAYYVQGTTKLLELLTIALLVTHFGSAQAAAATVVAVMAFVDMAIIAIFARRKAPWARIDFRHTDWTWFGAQLKPTLGFLLGNFATQGIMAQAPRVALSALLGGQAVAIYAVYGTAMRFVDQLLLMLVLPLEVEIAHSAGREDLGLIGRLVVVGTHVSWCLFLLVVAGLLFFGPLIFHIWTADRIAFSYSLMLLYCCMSGANLQGRVGLHALISTNRLYGPSYFMLITAVLAVGAGAVLTTLMGIRGMVVGGIVGELVNSAIVIVALAHWLRKPTAALISSFADLPSTFSELKYRSQSMLYRLRLGA